MSIFTFAYVILHLAFCCTTAKAADVDLTCQKWRNECPASLYCTLQNAKFNAATCKYFDMIADFRFKSKGSTVATPECIVNFTTSCKGTLNEKGCGCSKYPNKYIFRQDLVVTDAKHANGSWSCQALCLDATLKPALLTSADDTCSNIKIIYFVIEWRGIVLLCVGTVLLIVGIIMIIAAGLGIAGKLGIAVGCIGCILLIAGSVLMTVAYIDDEPAGIAFLWAGSILLITLGIVISITGDPGGAQTKPNEAASEGGGMELQQPPGDDLEPVPEDRVPCQKCDLSVLVQVGIGFMCVGGTLAIIGGIVAATEQCPSGDFPTTLQEKRGLILAIIGFVVFVVWLIIEIVAVVLIKKKN